MTTTRRILVLAGLVLAVMVGTSIPASATFSRTAAVPTMAVSTVTVQAPSWTNINDYCSTTSSSYWNGWTTVTTYSYWYTASVTWAASTSPGVTGYRVMAHLNNGQSVVMGETTATNRTVSATVDRSYLSLQPRISIITLTSYGWTAETPRSAILAC